MNSAQMSVLLRHIRTLAGDRNSNAPLDGELLERFSASRDEEAFADLVQRHGPMVWSVCRHVLHNWHDAEDVFQATFLVLARKSVGIYRPESLASWLYGVAYHLAVKAQARSADGLSKSARLRKSLENRRRDMASADPLLDMTWRELRTTLYEELSRLPEKNRTPLVLCYLQGKTQGEAARLLGWTKETVRGRLDRGREQLRKRLTRRGLALTSALFSTLLAHDQALAVPASLLKTTVKSAALMAAGNVAAGAISTKVTALASGGLKDLFVSKVKITVAVLLAVCTAGTGVGFLGLRSLAGGQGQTNADTRAKFISRLARRDDAPKQSSPKQNPVPSAAPKEAAKAPDQEKMTITGRVLDSNGKPLAGADVAMMAWAKGQLRSQQQGPSWPKALAQGKADDQGRFHLAVPQTSRELFWDVFVMAHASEHALGVRDVDPDARQSAVEVRLSPEAVLAGRLVDLQGQPAPGVRIQVVGIGGQIEGHKRPWVNFRDPPQDLSSWPESTTSDDQGRFSLRGLDNNWTVSVTIQDDRFARQRLEIGPRDKKKPGQQVTLSLAPVRVVEGDVTYADTGKPVPNSRVDVMVRSDRVPGSPNPVHFVEGQADQQGRFRVSLPIGQLIAVAAYPAAGTPYLPLTKDMDWPKAQVIKQEMHLALPRGVLLNGSVIEAASGKPVSGALILFVPFRNNNPFYRRDVFPHSGRESISGPDGKFELAVLPGPGHLLVNGPTLDYLHAVTTEKELYGVGIPSRRYYPDAIADLNLKPDAARHTVVVTLRRGIRLKGNVLGPDGKPIAEAVMLCRSYIPYGYDLNGIAGKGSKPIKDGQFELPGCDPEKPAEVFFFDAKNRLGAVITLNGKQASKPTTVQLQPCGAAKARFVDENGKAVANFRPFLEILITPGISVWDYSFDSKDPSADTAFMSTLDRDHDKLQSDAQGRITLPSLIPGATYWIAGPAPNGGIIDFHTEFKVQAGQTLDLGDITIKPRKQGVP